MHNIDLLHSIAPILLTVSVVFSILLLVLIVIFTYTKLTSQSISNNFIIKNIGSVSMFLVITILFSICIGITFLTQKHLIESTSPSGNLTVKLNANLNEIKVFSKNNKEKYPHYTKVTNVRLTVGMESITTNDAVISWEDDVLTILIFNSAGDYNIKVWIDPYSNTIKHTKKIENTI